MSNLPMATPVTLLFQADPKRRPSEYATATELTRAAPGTGATVQDWDSAGSVVSATNPLYASGRPGPYPHENSPSNAEVAAPESKAGPKDIESGSTGSLTTGLLKRKAAPGSQDAKRASVILPGLRFPVPPSRVLVTFDFGRFLRTLFYNIAFPFSLPFLLAREGRIAAENMAFLISPMKIAGAFTW